MSAKGFDRIATIYDTLARFLFGSSITEAQFEFLYYLPDYANVLILGGGTGTIISQVLSTKSNCKIWYIEASEKMLAIARERNQGNNSNVQFIQGTENNISREIKYDVVIANFYLDLFSNESLPQVIDKINGALSPRSQWIVADFVRGDKWWQRVLLWIMYRFFRNVCNIEAATLPEWEKCLKEGMMTIVNEKFFYQGFIKSAIYHGPKT